MCILPLGNEAALVIRPLKWHYLLAENVFSILAKLFNLRRPIAMLPCHRATTGHTNFSVRFPDLLLALRHVEKPNQLYPFCLNSPVLPHPAPPRPAPTSKLRFFDFSVQSWHAPAWAAIP